MIGRGPVYLLRGDRGAQEVYEVTFLKAGADPVTTYTEDRRLTGETVYALESEPMVAAELSAAGKTFKGTIYRGAVARGGAPLAANLTVKVRRVLRASAAANGGRRRQSFGGTKYFLFGGGRELFALRLAGKDAEAAAVRVNVTSGVPDADAAQRLRDGAYIDAAQEIEAGRETSATAQLGAETYDLTLRGAVER